MATLHASRFTLHASRFIKKGFCSAALIGVVSLSLAACGGGDSTVQTAPVTQTPPNDGEPDCTAVPRPAGCPDPEPTPPAVPLPLDGLGQAAKGGAAPAIREVADTLKVQVFGNAGSTHPLPARLAIQGLNLRQSRTNLAVESLLDQSDTKLPNVETSKKGDNIVYSFELFTPKVVSGRTAFSTGLGQLTNVLPDEHKIFSLKDNNAYTSVKRIESIATQFGEGWDYSILKASVPSVKDGDKDSTLYAELWTDLSSSGVSDTNYMVGGWWLLAPNNAAGDYRFGVLAKVQNYYNRSSTGPVKEAVLGEATYKGNAAGLHLSSENGMASVQRLLGKVTLSADFGNPTARGTIGGKIHDLSLDGESAMGEILLPTITLGDLWVTFRPIVPTNTNINPKSRLGNIKGVNYQGDWAGTFQGDSSGNDQPTGIVGVVGGSGGGNSFVASFGAKKVEDE